MSGIYHQNKEWANVTTPNPAGTASTDLTKLGIDGVNYNVKDANAAPNEPTFTEASTRENLNGSGETIATIFGKIKKFFSDLKTVAFTGAYSDLSGTPTIPTVNDATLTIQKNGTAVETFTANSSTNKTANITVPTKTSDLTNDSGFVTTDEKVTATVAEPSSETVYDLLTVPHSSQTTNQQPSVNTDSKAYIKQGTAGSAGWVYLSAGNNTPTGTAGNKYGALRLYSEKSGYVDLAANAASTNGRTIRFPNASGTVALTSDITDEKVTGQVQNPTSNTWYNVPFIGTSNQKPYVNDGLTYATKEGTANSAGWSCLVLGNAVASTSAGSKHGELWLQGDTTNYVKLGVDLGITGNRSINLPDKNGTVALTSDVPTKLSDLTNDLNKIKDIGNGQDTTFAYSKAGLNYDDVSWLAAWNGYELRALDKNKLSIGYVPIRKDYDTYTQLAKWYGGTTEPPYVRIAFPTGISTVWTMLNIEILFRQNYANDLGGKILINCHHNQTSPYAWVGNATVYGFVRKSDIKVYGSDGHYLYIEGIDSYTTLSIDKVLVGDTARSIDLTSTTIDYVSALPSTYQTFTMYTDVDSTNIANQSVDKATKDGDGNVISSTYAKKPLYATGSVSSGKTGVQKIAQITLSEVGTYYITGWAKFTGGGKKAVQLWCAGTLGESWEDSTIATGEPKTFSTFAIYTSTVANEDVKVNSYTVSASNAVTGGLVAFKIA